MAGNFSEVSPWFASGSISSSYTSTPFRVGDFDAFCVQISITGTYVGTTKLQASIDDITYIDVPDTSLTNTGADSYLYSVAFFAYKYIRVVFTRTGGTGTISAKINTINNQT